MKGFAAGLMLSISFFDLAHNAINAVGFLKGNLWVSYLVHNCFECNVYSFFLLFFCLLPVNWQHSSLQGSFSLLLLPISSQNRLLLPFQIEKVKRSNLFLQAKACRLFSHQYAYWYWVTRIS